MPKIPEGISTLENYFFPDWKQQKTHFFWKAIGISFFRRKSHSTEKPKRRPIKFAKCFFQDENVVKCEGVPFYRKKCFEKTSHSAEKNRMFFAELSRKLSSVHSAEKARGYSQNGENGFARPKTSEKKTKILRKTFFWIFFRKMSPVSSREPKTLRSPLFHFSVSPFYF